jgi:hypothetical protein
MRRCSVGEEEWIIGLHSVRGMGEVDRDGDRGTVSIATDTLFNERVMVTGRNVVNWNANCSDVTKLNEPHFQLPASNAAMV